MLPTDTCQLLTIGDGSSVLYNYSHLTKAIAYCDHFVGLLSHR
jgi:hypothetical protein